MAEMVGLKLNDLNFYATSPQFDIMIFELEFKPTKESHPNLQLMIEDDD